MAKEFNWENVELPDGWEEPEEAPETKPETGLGSLQETEVVPDPEPPKGPPSLRDVDPGVNAINPSKILEVILDASDASVTPQVPFDNDNATQSEWIKTFDFKTKNEGYTGYIPSLADFYLLFKQIRDQNLVSPLASDLFSGTNNNKLRQGYITSTRTIGRQFGNQVDVVNNYLSDRQTTIQRVDVSEYENISLVDVVQDPLGLKCLQTYFNTTDTAEEICKVLETGSGRSRDQIVIYAKIAKSLSLDYVSFLEFSRKDIGEDTEFCIGLVGNKSSSSSCRGVTYKTQP
jgi:hypothetical protein